MTVPSKFTEQEMLVISEAKKLAEKTMQLVHTLISDMVGTLTAEQQRAAFNELKILAPKPTKPTALERLHEEFADLEDKIDKLAPFFKTPTYKGLPREHQILLKKQHQLMVQYHRILEQRIELF